MGLGGVNPIGPRENDRAKYAFSFKKVTFVHFFSIPCQYGTFCQLARIFVKNRVFQSKIANFGQSGVPEGGGTPPQSR